MEVGVRADGRAYERARADSDGACAVNDLIQIFENDDESTDRRILHGIAYLIQLAEDTNQKVSQIMSAQDDINSAIAALQADETGLDASVQAITAEIASLTAAGVDTTALNAEVANLATHVASVAALAPTAPPA